MMGSRVAVVTGSNQGVGFGIVRRLLKENPSWTVYLTARSEERGAEAVKELEKEGLKPLFHQLDICDIASIQRIRKHLQDTHGGLDVLVNNAGIAFKVAATEEHAVKVEQTTVTNVFGTMDVCKELIPILRDGARVVILASMVIPGTMKKLGVSTKQLVQRQPPLTLGEITELFNNYISSVKSGTFAAEGFPDDSSYSMSKIGNALTAMAYQELFKADSRKDMVVNSCCPGWVNTNMTSHKGKKTIDEGAETPSYLALLPPGTDIKGQFLTANDKIVDWYSL